MTHAPRNDSTEQRRRLLKGALGASTVVTLGYGAPAAASSLVSCVAKIRDGAADSPRYPMTQFTTIEPSESASDDWAWEAVEVRTYQSQPTVSYLVINPGPNEELYTTDSEPIPVTPAPTGPYSTSSGWVMVYFDENGERMGTYPTYKPLDEQFAPATASCLTSLNAGVRREGFTYGG